MRQNVCSLRRAERRGGLLLLLADLAQHRYQLARDERQADERRRDRDRGEREHDLVAVLGQPRPEPAGVREDEHEREADDDRRERQREVDEGAEDASASGPLRRAR